MPFSYQSSPLLFHGQHLNGMESPLDWLLEALLPPHYSRKHLQQSFDVAQQGQCIWADHFAHQLDSEMEPLAIIKYKPIPKM